MMSYHMILSYDTMLENFVRTENKQTDRQRTENSKPEATLIPVNRRGERANSMIQMSRVHDSTLQ